MKKPIVNCLTGLALLLSTSVLAAEEYCNWQLRQEGVLFFVDEPLCGLEGDPDAGREMVKNRRNANCLACHKMPVPEEDFHGEIGPPLYGVGARYAPAELRIRLIDEAVVNPQTIMPGFYRHPSNNNRLTYEYAEGTMLSAQQIEDIVAYLATLRNDDL